MNTKEGRTLVGHVAEIHRYPVKSMQGECLERATLGPDGLDGHRPAGLRSRSRHLLAGLLVHRPGHPGAGARSHFSAIQIITVPSSLPDARQPPEGENATAFTRRAWPRKV